MARGGKRTGAGRKAGSTTKRTREIANMALDAGVSPLEFMLGVMRDESLPTDARFEAAKASAPYVHPRLNAVEHSGVDGGPLEVVTRIELVAPGHDDSAR